MESASQPKEVLKRLTSETKAAFWQRVIDKWLASNEHQERFCRAHGLSFAQFGYWRTRLKQSTNNQQPKLLPVQVSTSPPALSHAIQIRLPTGVVISVPPESAPVQIKQVLELLGVPTCSQ